MSAFKTKMPQIRFRLGLRPRPHALENFSTLQTRSWISEVLLLRRGKEGKAMKEKEREMKGKTGR